MTDTIEALNGSKTFAEQFRETAQAVLDCWESGDLAHAVRQLDLICRLYDMSRPRPGHAATTSQKPPCIRYELFGSTWVHWPKTELDDRTRELIDHGVQAFSFLLNTSELRGQDVSFVEFANLIVEYSDSPKATACAAALYRAQRVTEQVPRKCYSRSIEMPKDLQQGTANHVQMIVNALESGNSYEALMQTVDLLDQLQTRHLTVSLRSHPLSF